MIINNLEQIDINNSKQWVLVKGKNAGSPLIIHVQAGPGLPMIPEAGKMEKLLHFEETHLVAYWDQRACGKSFDKNIDPKTMNLMQLTDDIIACTRYLLRKYKKDKAILIGYSIGATIGLLAAAKESNLFSRIFLVGIDIDMQTANKYAIDFAFTKATSLKNKKQQLQARELENLPMTEPKAFQKRAELLSNLGGINTQTNYNGLFLSTVWAMLTSPHYNLSDILKTIKGMEFCQAALLPEFDNLNLFERVKQVSIPVHFIQGAKDGIAPHHVAESFFNSLRADRKSFDSFESSAHMPHYEEPDKFSQMVTSEGIN